MKIFSIGIIIAALLIVISYTRELVPNTCGGTQKLYGSSGDYCDPGEWHGSRCRKGLLECHGTEALICTPQCDSPKDDDPYIFCRSNPCSKHGVCSDLHKKCVCFPNYKGSKCKKQINPTTPNTCSEMDCGKHGICQYGQCICDEGFSGSICESRIACLPGGNWDGEQCVCRPGFSGKLCDECEANALCLPSKMNEGKPDDDYALLRVSETIYNQLLRADPPPGYTYGPIQPGTFSEHFNRYYDCQCKAVEPESSLRENFADDYGYSDSSYSSSSSSSSCYNSPYYLNDYYDHYYFPQKKFHHNDTSNVAAVVGFILVFFFFFVLIYFASAFLYPEPYSYGHVDPVHHLVSQKLN